MHRSQAKAGYKQVCQRSGFSLLELSIVIAIFSTMAVLGLEVIGKILTRKSYSTTQAQLTTLDENMMKFYRVYGRLPCPAARGTLASNSGFGLEDCSAAPANNVMTGIVPFRTLNLPVSAMIDGYGNRINYAVTKQLTTSSATFSANTAQIEVRSGTLQQPCTTSCTVLANPATGDGAAYFMFSSGEDKRGAVSAFGVAGPACYTTTSDTRIDAQNCANGALTVGIAAAVYYDSRYNNGLQSGNYFDDIVIWRTRGRML